MNRKKVLIIIAGILGICCIGILAIGIINSSLRSIGILPTYTATAPPTTTFTSAPPPTDVPTLVPSQTPVPSITPTYTPVPSPTTPPSATPPPEPVLLTGTGDAVVDFVNPFEIAIVHIIGNSSGGFFAVTNYDDSGEQIDLLVNTTDPYDGIRPLDFRADEHTTRFEVSASGDWSIEILPLVAARIIAVPGKVEGKGDEVFLLSGGRPDTALIQGNASSVFFAVTSYSASSADLLVNETDPYNGTVIMDPEALIIEVIASDNWTIDITSK